MEALGGWSTNSAAILSDALHDVTPAADTQTLKRVIVDAARLDRIAHVAIEFERLSTPCDNNCGARG